MNPAEKFASSLVSSIKKSISKFACSDLLKVFLLERSVEQGKVEHTLENLKRVYEDVEKHLQNNCNPDLVLFLQTLTKRKSESNQQRKQRLYSILLIVEIIYSLCHSKFTGHFQFILTTLMWIMSRCRKSLTLLNNLGIGVSYPTMNRWCTETVENFLKTVEGQIAVPTEGLAVFAFDNIQKKWKTSRNNVGMNTTINISTNMIGILLDYKDLDSIQQDESLAPKNWLKKASNLSYQNFELEKALVERRDQLLELEMEEIIRNIKQEGAKTVKDMVDHDRKPCPNCGLVRKLSVF